MRQFNRRGAMSAEKTGVAKRLRGHSPGCWKAVRKTLDDCASARQFDGRAAPAPPTASPRVGFRREYVACARPLTGRPAADVAPGRGPCVNLQSGGAAEAV